MVGEASGREPIVEGIRLWSERPLRARGEYQKEERKVGEVLSFLVGRVVDVAESEQHRHIGECHDFGMEAIDRSDARATEMKRGADENHRFEQGGIPGVPEQGHVLPIIEQGSPLATARKTLENGRHVLVTGPIISQTDTREILNQVSGRPDIKY